MRYTVDSLHDPSVSEITKAEIRGLIQALELAEWQNEVYRSYIHDCEHLTKVMDEDYNVTDIHLELAEVNFNKYRNLWKTQLDEQN